MGLTTRQVLERVARHESANPPVPPSPGTTGHTSMYLEAHGTAKAKEGVLETVGSAFGWMIEKEKQATAKLPNVPYPRMPAARAWDQINGFKHAHNHYPNTITVPPMPLPTDGPIVPLPILSCADRTKIGKLPAARCGDLGMSIWCGSYFPFNEIYLGSKTVWIESARAARLLDMTRQCLFSAPRPADLPLGPPIGAVTSGKLSVFIGGAPTPSMTSMALAAPFELPGLAARGFGAAARAFRRLRALPAKMRTLRRFLKHVWILGDEAYAKAVKRRLAQFADTECGRAELNRLVDAGQDLRIGPAERGRPCVEPDGYNGYYKTRLDPNGPVLANTYDSQGRIVRQDPCFITGRGEPTGSTIRYNPDEKMGEHPPDVVLAHELSHAGNFSRGESKCGLAKNEPFYTDRWRNIDEQQAVGAENRYRNQAEKGMGRPYYYHSGGPGPWDVKQHENRLK